MELLLPAGALSMVTIMTFAQHLIIALTVAFPILASAQPQQHQSGPPPETLPEMRAAAEEYALHLAAARELKKAGHLQEALSEAAKAVPCIARAGQATSYELAREIAQIYLLLGNPDKAIEAYRDGYEWKGEWFTVPRSLEGPDYSPTFITEYAATLAKYGRPEAAQMIFYSEMLSMQKRDRMWVPPLLLTFEPDPKGDYWEYSDKRLQSAMLVLDSLSFRTVAPVLTERASELFPEWYYPYMVQAVMDSDTMTLAEREQLLDTAYAKARTDQERHWVEDVRSVIKLDPKMWNTELRKFAKLWPGALNSVQTYQTKWAELRANWRDYGVERAQMFASGE